MRIDGFGSLLPFFARVLILITGIATLCAAEDVTGYWKRVNDKSGHTLSIAAVYKYQEKIYSRILVSYNEAGAVEDSIVAPKKRVESILGAPFLAGLDFVWGLIDTGKKWDNGKIIDPETAKIYSCEIWLNEEELIIRGKVGIFGKNTTWKRASKEELPFPLPDLRNFRPRIPKPR